MLAGDPRVLQTAGGWKRTPAKRSMSLAGYA